MIIGIEGRPGSGKSYLLTRLIYDSLWRGRKVYTNVPSFSIHKAAWGIYYSRAVSRQRVLDRYFLLTPKDISQLHTLNLTNCDIYLDEVMIAWLSRDWAKMDRGLINWFSQHRKYHVTFHYVAQSIDRVDSTLRDMTQEYICMRNTANWRFGFLRLPELLIAIHFAEDRKSVLKRRYYPVNKFYTSMYDSWAVFGQAEDEEQGLQRSGALRARDRGELIPLVQRMKNK